MFPFEIVNLGAGFKKYFEILPALTEQLREHVYRIRHGVYCEELKFEPERPDRRERDEYRAWLSSRDTARATGKRASPLAYPRTASARCSVHATRT